MGELGARDVALALAGLVAFVIIVGVIDWLAVRWRVWRRGR